MPCCQFVEENIVASTKLIDRVIATTTLKPLHVYDDFVLLETDTNLISRNFLPWFLFQCVEIDYRVLQTAKIFWLEI